MLLATLAHAVTIDEGRAAAIAANLVPKVEAAAGRTFVEPPRVRLGSLATIQERTDRFAALVGGAPRVISPADLGLYQPATQDVWLVADALERVFRKADLGPALLEPVVRCVLAHELVHALQHQRIPGPSPADEVGRALREGHADLVAGRVCGAGAPWLDRVEGLDVPASRPPDDPHAFAYGYAEDFLAVVDAEVGVEGAWALMAGAPPPREFVVRVGGLGRPAGWDDADRLAPVGEALTRRAHGRTDAGPLAPWRILAPLAPDDAPTAAIGGLGWFAGDGTRNEAGVMAFLLPDARAARAFVAGRRIQLHRPRFMTFVELGSFGAVFFAPLPRARWHRGVNAVVGARSVDDDFAWIEGWAAAGPLLVGAAVDEYKARSGWVDRALTALLDLGLSVAPAEVALPDADRAAIVALAASPPAATRVNASWRAAQLNPALSRGDHAACAEHVAAHLGGLAPADRRLFAVLGLKCAAGAEAGDVAARILLALPAADLSPAEALTLAAFVAGLPEAVLAAFPADGEGELAAEIDGLKIEAALALGRLDEVERLLARRVAPPIQRAAAAVDLARLGRADAARRVLAETCPALQGEPAKVCRAAQARVGR